MTDRVLKELSLEGLTYIAREPLPGQFDQRADSAVKSIQLIGGGKELQVFWSELLILEGQLAETAVEKIRKYHINTVEYRVKDMEATLFLNEMKKVSKIRIFDYF
nr:hypothetical protein [endosymbiont 'TC1' of Trimyema compressum]